MKKYRLPLFLLLLAMSSVTAFSLIGSEVQPDGTLVEPFFLVPLAYLFLTSSIVSAIAIGLRSIFSRKPRVQ